MPDKRKAEDKSKAVETTNAASKPDEGKAQEGAGTRILNFLCDMWEKYLKYYRKNRIRGIGTVGLALCMVVSVISTFKLSSVDYFAIIASWFKSSDESYIVSSSDTEESVESEMPLSGFNITVKFTYGTICSEPSMDTAIQNTVEKGQTFTVLDTSGDFYKIEYLDNRYGWIDKYYVEVEGYEEPELVDDNDPVELSGDIASELKTIFDDYGTMGAGVAIIEDGKVTYTYSYGYANKSLNKKIDSDTKFRPASLSKVISTLATMTLVDAGKLDLDTDIGDYFGYKFRNPYFSSTVITARELLNHTSSLDDEYILYTGSNAGTLLKDLAVSIDSYKNQKPGEEYSYSNSGFGVLGALDEVITNTSYIYFTDSVLFDRLGIDAAYGGQSLEDTDNVAECYKSGVIARTRAQIVKTRTIKDPGETYILAQGSLVISPKDYAKLVTIFINDGMYGNLRILSEEAVEEIETTYISDENFEYCLGWKKTTNYVDGHTLYYHGGNAYGVYASACYDEEQKSGVVVMTSGAIGYVDDNNFFLVCQDITQKCYSAIIDS